MVATALYSNVPTGDAKNLKKTLAKTKDAINHDPTVLFDFQRTFKPLTQIYFMSKSIALKNVLIFTRNEIGFNLLCNSGLFTTNYMTSLIQVRNELD